METANRLLKITDQGRLTEHTLASVSRLPDEGKIIRRLQERALNDQETNRIIAGNRKLKTFIWKGQ